MSGTNFQVTPRDVALRGLERDVLDYWKLREAAAPEPGEYATPGAGDRESQARQDHYRTVRQRVELWLYQLDLPIATRGAILDNEGDRLHYQGFWGWFGEELPTVNPVESCAKPWSREVQYRIWAHLVDAEIVLAAQLEEATPR